MQQKKIMLGNEAFALGAYEAGVCVSSAYPGTPSTEISENLAKYEGVYCEWAPNEKVAMEVAVGASFAGKRSLCAMKMVGVNVAADPLYSSAYTGVGGGLVLVAADDPGIYSSQNEQDTRMVARAAQVPVIEPSDSSEAKEFIKFAFDLSEKYDTPVIVRSTTRLSHSQGEVTVGERKSIESKAYEKDIQKNVMMPAMAIKRHVVVEERMERLAKDACDFEINRIEKGDGKIGFITCGIAYQYVKEVCPDASVLKLGLVNPLPRKLIEDFAKSVDKLYIFEELEPVIEEQVRSWGISCTGKDLFTKQGEYSANLLRKKLFDKPLNLKEAADVPPRPPILCPGCPHRSVYSVLSKLKIHASGDIGCYTLGALAPLSVIDTCVCMGASISMLHGMEKARGKDYIKNWVAVIGDSTFLHTGVNSLMNMAYNGSAGTVIILDNSTTGMTGHQDNPATGKTLMGESVVPINLKKLIQAMGISNVTEIDAFDVDGLTELIKDYTQKEELCVIITKSPCALLKGVSFPNVCVEDEDKCRKCGACLKPGCPAMSKNENGTIHIDPTMCNGCGLCMKLCRFDAINIKEK